MILIEVNKELTIFLCCQLFDHFRDAFFVSAPRFLWNYYSVVNADIVDQAGEEGTGFHTLAAANV